MFLRRRGLNAAQVQALIDVADDGFGAFICNQDPRLVASTATMGANLSVFWRFRVKEQITVTTIKTYNGGTVAGNLDAGIYTTTDASVTLTRLASSGSVAASGTSAWQTLTLSGPVTLEPGTDYWYGAATSDATHTVLRISGIGAANALNNLLVGKTATFPLPLSVTVSTVSTAANAPVLVAQ